MESLTAAEAAVEANLIQYFREFARFMPRVELYDGDDLFWSLTDIPFPVFNSLMRTRAAASDLPALIEAAQARARSKAVPIMWFDGPGSRPVDLGAALAKYGFQKEDSVPGMIADLRALPDPRSVPPGMKIERVKDVAMLRAWCDVLCAGFEVDAFVGDAIVELGTNVGFEPAAVMHRYLASWNGEPVATASLFAGAGVAGIYDVASLARARGQGIGGAVTHRALCDARAAGLSTAILLATPLGYGIYERLGFVECCRYTQYLWDPGSTPPG